MRVLNMAEWAIGTQDEALHRPEAATLWNESFYFDFVTPDGELGGYVRLGLYPSWGKAWYWACLVGRDRAPILVLDNEAPMPGQNLTVTTPAYEAAITVDRALESARVTLRSQDLSLDLGWETAGGVYGYSLTPRYEIPCLVRGTINGLPFEGHGERDHSWGERDWWSLSWLWASGRLEDGTFLHGMQANIGMPLPWPAFTVPPGGQVEHAEGFAAASEFDGDLPAESRLDFPGMATLVRPLAFAPVTLQAPDGRLAEFPRAMCRFTAQDGRIGYGWAEWHQPPGWEQHGWHPLL
ncbi:MAG: hypothetical protein HOY71_12820 [Nonomuraea sp.]|nr:hypothetical protein [Nonomuraea sp.]